MANQTPPGTVVDDSGDMLGFHLRRILGATRTQVLIGVFVVLAAAIGFAIEPLFGLIGAVIALAVSLIVVYFMASAASTSSFFDVYAAQRRMAHTGKGPLPAATPLLCKGDDRYAEQIPAGTARRRHRRHPRPLHLRGHLLRQRRQPPDQLLPLHGRHLRGPRVGRARPHLYARRKFGLKALEKVEDAFRSVERVELESEALDDRYEIFVAPGQDQVWLRRLFSPTFIVWLTDSAPEKFAFELLGGSLCCYVKGHRKKADGLDRMRVATAAVARRLHEECAED